MIKMIISDLDRTLLRNDKTISQYTIDVFKECKRRGLLVVAATARPLRAITHYHEMIGFDASITLNGACVNRGATTSNDAIPKEEVDNIVRMLNCYDGCVISLESSEGIFSNVDIPEWNPKVYANLLEAPIPDVVYKIIVSSQTMDLSSVLEDRLPDTVYYSVANGDLFQIMSKKATKWNGIQSLMKAYEISADDIVFFGDDHDDVEAIQNCGIGVAVSNAIPEVRKVADRFADSNENDGVAKFIQEEIL